MSFKRVGTLLALLPLHYLDRAKHLLQLFERDPRRPILLESIQLPTHRGREVRWLSRVLNRQLTESVSDLSSESCSGELFDSFEGEPFEDVGVAPSCSDEDIDELDKRRVTFPATLSHVA
jgi:hypothetical protein